MGSWALASGFKSQLCHLWGLSSCSNNLTLCFNFLINFLICKGDLIIVCTSWSCHKEYISWHTETTKIVSGSWEVLQKCPLLFLLFVLISIIFSIHRSFIEEFWYLASHYQKKLKIYNLLIFSASYKKKKICEWRISIVLSGKLFSTFILLWCLYTCRINK